MEHPTRDNLLITTRHLPHWQLGGRTYFLTFRTAGIQLSPEERNLVIERIKVGRDRFFGHHISIVMPDHVHMLTTPMESESDSFHSLERILKGIKGSSARDINRLRGRTGTVWQDESYDRIIRNHDEFAEKYLYIQLNPVRRGLVSESMEYPHFLMPEHWYDGIIEELLRH